MQTQEGLEALRREIDRVDDGLLQLLARRQALVDQIVFVKREIDLPARIPQRIEDIIHRLRVQARIYHVSEDLVEILWRAMIDWFIAHEEQILKSGR